MRSMTGVFLCLLISASAAFAAEQRQPPRGQGEGVPPLPQAITSFGAAADGDWVYVYGGHIGRAHAHSDENLARGFHRLNLAARAGSWEPLPMGTPLQGLPMVADQGRVYRVGGLSMRNKPDEDEQLHSVDEFHRYDPASSAWEALAPLPEPRSSHDAAVLDGKLYVIGGWRLSGDSDSAVWAERGYVADLRAPQIGWKPLPPQPFKHRALAVAATSKRVYAIGGLNADGKPTSEVHIFDPEAQTWTQGPDLPTATRAKAFAASAFGVGDTIWASAIDGRVYRLDEGAEEWTDTAYDLKAPRFFHRVVPHRDRSLLFIGGASKSGHIDTVEAVELATLHATPVEGLSSATSTARKKPRADQVGSDTWPAFRGAGDSHTDAVNLPVKWSDEKGVAWRADLPGYGQSSPVVWRGKVFATSIEGDSQETLHVTCVDTKGGEKIWSRSFPASQTVQSSGYVSKAAPTPAVDEQRLYLFFESGDLIALDHEGNTIWQRSLVKEYGPFKGNHGLGASVAVTGDSVIVLVDHDGPSYLLSVDKATGANRWKADRQPRVSWSSPIVSRTNGREEIIISSNGAVDAYDARSGQRLWSLDGLAGNTVASPSVVDDLVIVGSSENGSNICIERPTGSGEPRIKWRAEGALASFASPLVHRGAVYYVNKAGVATCVDLASGRSKWSLRLPSSCWASPVAAGDLVYFFCTAGQTLVIQAGTDQPIKVGESRLEVEGRVYGVAAVDEMWVLRSGKQLIAVTE